VTEEGEAGYREAAGLSLAHRRAQEIHYRATWHRRRSWKVATVLLTVGLVSAACSDMMIPWTWMQALVVVWLVVMTISACQPCPRCGKPFSIPRKSWLLWRRVKQCIHCGLPRGAPHDPDAEEAGRD
jgi:hypothetical protein